MKKASSTTDPLWYKDAIIYELHVRAFADSNGDGIGDFQGLISKLDYLQDLGVTCLWLLPFFPSPLKDDGYDIANYLDVNPSYGTIDDFREFLDAAHARNMQVMIELVINHSSDQHPWFQAARRAPKGSPEREMYVWSDTDKLYDGVRIIFTDTEKSNWTWDDVAGQYYWHRFFSHQPDLNFDNPRVMEEVLNAMRFWLDMGVDGLRLDAIPYLVERDGTSCENVPETHVVIKQIRKVIDEEYENRLILAEANMWPEDVRPYFGDDDECHMAFHFPLMPRIYMAVRQEDRLPITDIMAQTPDIPANCQWGLFLRNHDELTLEMVTDEERDYMYMAYSADPRMRINVGIRRRLAPLLDNNRRRIELLNSLLFSFPGTPIMYYGDEIGMGDNIYLGDRNGVRTPMQWNSDRNAGFSKAVPAKLYFPVIMDPIWGYQAINVEAQQSDPSSLLHWTRNMIALRKLFRVFGRGTLHFLHPANRKILAYIRSYEFEDGHCETILCVANLSRFAQPVQLDLSKYVGRQPVEMLGYVPFPAVDKTPYALTLAPYSFLWLELQEGASIPEAPVVEEPAAALAERAAAISAMPMGSLGTLLNESSKALLEQVLPQYIAQRRWFGGKSRTIRSTQITSVTPIPGTSAALSSVNVLYEDGTSDLYQLPLAMATDGEAETIREKSPNAVIATVNRESGPVTLYDATASAEFRTSLLQLIVKGSEIALELGASSASFAGTKAKTLDGRELLDLPSRVGSAEQSNTSILFGDQAILKMFRRLRTGENPDVEITRFLTEVAHYPNIPAYLGDLHRTDDGTTLAFLQVFAPNEGDGWEWTLEELARYFESVANCPAPASTGETPRIGAANEIPPEAREHAGLFLEAALLLGRRTGELHVALATPTENQAFAAEGFTDGDLAAERERILAQARTARETLAAGLDRVPAEVRDDAQQLIDGATSIEALLDGLSGDAGRFGQRIRIHGDYHLGQTLRSRSDFLLVDFEGEPARTLEERRRKQSPLRDVAGMLRSFSYAAQSGLQRATQRRPDTVEAMRPWATLWENASSAAYLQGYAEAVKSRPELLPQPEETRALLAALLLEKAFYELLYELNNRPTWLAIPLHGLLTLLQTASDAKGAGTR
ncbi:MAG TPA: maltose alpha-D-glucosyltransferase [Acidobacteriaceae bacterium]|nr:maltose alpha-D-glucosyltransferase [Acidobacteriaceae bacterium]